MRIFLGENILWQSATKISKAIGMLSKLRHFVPSSVLVNIYNALITLYLTYGLISWGGACKTYPDKIPYPSKTCSTPNIFCKQNKIMSFIIRKCLCTAIKFLVLWIRLKLNARNRRKNAPINILYLFSRTSNSHYYSTRSSTQNFCAKKSRLDIRKNAFSRVGAKMWNEMPNSLKTYQGRPSEKNLKKLY